jgi:diaminopimelate epimerase
LGKKLQSVEVTKGHGTANDFVLFSDPENLRDLSEAGYRDLADRHRGVGGDGSRVASHQLDEADPVHVPL